MFVITEATRDFADFTDLRATVVQHTGANSKDEEDKLEDLFLTLVATALQTEAPQEMTQRLPEPLSFSYVQNVEQSVEVKATIFLRRAALLHRAVRFSSTHIN